MATHLRTSLVTSALNMAIAERRPAGVIHHSDQGCQYTHDCEQIDRSTFRTHDQARDAIFNG